MAMLTIPDINFVVVAQAHTTAGRKWLAKRMMPVNDMRSGVVASSVDHAGQLGNEAVRDGLLISGLVDPFPFREG
jgi:hypothetical protein